MSASEVVNDILAIHREAVALEREAVVDELERRAARLRQRARDGHPSPDEDMAAARQLEIAAGDIKAGLHAGDDRA